MRQTIELLKKQSIQAGLTSAHMQSMGQQVNGKNGIDGSPSKKSLNGSHETGLHQNGNNGMQRHHSTDSVCSINSVSSNCSGQDKKKKKGWVRTLKTFISFVTKNRLSSYEVRSPKLSRETRKSQRQCASQV